MSSTTTYLSPIVSLISLWTAAGILMHDIQIDAAAVTALSPSSENRQKNSVALPDPHTHPEHNPMIRTGKNSQPRIQPKRQDYRSSVSERRLKKDNYSEKPTKSALRSAANLA